MLVYPIVGFVIGILFMDIVGRIGFWPAVATHVGFIAFCFATMRLIEWNERRKGNIL